MNIEQLLDMKPENIEISKQDKIIIYGAGNFGKLCAQILRKHQYTLVGFIDKEKYKEVKEVESLPVFAPEDEFILKDKEKIICIIGIFNAYVDLSEIEQDLKSYFRVVINPLMFFDYFSNDIGDYFWLSNKENYNNHKDRLKKAYNLLDDDYSKKLFKNILEYRFSNKLSKLIKPQNVATQYFPRDIDCDFPPLKFVDCGAYIGDTVLNIFASDLTIDSYIGFEPDIENFIKLSSNLNKNAKNECFIYPCGVYSKSKQLKFNAGQGSGSFISNSGEEVINVVSLDEVVINKEINFIKMDIEGAEVEALLGAKNTIKKYQPILAISAYHKHDDLWTILETINEFCSSGEYKYFIRMYEYNGFEIVYYAIPNRFLRKEKNDK